MRIPGPERLLSGRRISRPYMEDPTLSSTPPPAPPQPPSSEFHQSLAQKIFIGPQGLRAGWRILLFLAISVAIITVCRTLVRFLLHPSRGAPGYWHFTLIGEAVLFGSVLFAAAVMGRIEDRPMRVYGLPGSRAFGRNFWAGCLWGALAVSGLLLAIWAAHGFTFGEIELAAPAAVRFGALWFVAFVAVGLFEEFSTRGYLQFTLGSGIGFWPAAVLLSAAFGGVHLNNPGEGWAGALAAALIGLWLAFTLRRTGDLWFAIGFHAMFDYGETFAFSVPNSGITFYGHLLHSSLHGPRWLTGGSVGPEGSVFDFILIAVLFVVFDRVYREKRFPLPQSGS